MAPTRRCEVFVPIRPYGQPGQCESRRSVKRAKIQGAKRGFWACDTHRRQVAEGKAPQLVGRDGV